MTDEEWDTPLVRSFGMLLGGDAMLEWVDAGERVFDDTFLLLFNGAPDAVPFILATTPQPSRWEVVLDTARPAAEQGGPVLDPGAPLELPGRTMVVLRRVERKRPPRRKKAS
jgi:glycogen operon protein